MASQPVPVQSALLASLGDFRWVRAHVSMYAVGVVLLVAANLIAGGSRLWSLTAVGIWSMLLVFHLLLLAIARLSNQLLNDDDEEIVLLPVKEGVIVDPVPTPDPTATWSTVETANATKGPDAETTETVSWQIATDAAQAKRQSNKPSEAETQ